MKSKWKLLVGCVVALTVVILLGIGYFSSTAKMAPKSSFYARVKPSKPGRSQTSEPSNTTSGTYPAVSGILVFAHQGGEGEWPCNTRLGLQESKKLGADVLDIDVHLNRDGHFYALHDATVDRTTDGTGAIADLPTESIAKLNAGYRFSPDGKTFPYRDKNLRIPELEELFAEFPQDRFGIELKTHTPDAARALAAVIAKHHRESTVLLSCFDQKAMNAFREASPTTATSASTDEVRTFAVMHKLGLARLISPAYSSLQVPIERSGFTLVSPSIVQAAHAKGVYVIPWTINEPATMKELIGMGVDGINTNFPSRLVEALTVR